jgi:hypothetical protein
MLAVIALDRENFPQNLLETLVATLSWPLVKLQEAVIRIGLNLREIRQVELALNTAKVDDPIHLENAFSGNRHASFSMSVN